MNLAELGLIPRSQHLQRAFLVKSGSFHHSPSLFTTRRKTPTRTTFTSIRTLPDVRESSCCSHCFEVGLPLIRSPPVWLQIWFVRAAPDFDRFGDAAEPEPREPMYPPPSSS